MKQIVHAFLIVALLVYGSHQAGTKPDNAGRSNPRPKNKRPGGNFYNTGTGPYDIEVHLIRICDDPGTYEANYKMEAYNSKTTNGSKIMYRGNFTVPFTREEMDGLDLRVLIYRTKDKKEFTMLNYTNNLCKSIMGPAKDVYMDIRKKLDLKKEECYVDKGFYKFSDWEVNAKLPPPVLEYGYYRATIEILHEQKRAFCMTANGVVKQKSS